KPMLEDPNRNIRREGVRVLGTRPPPLAGESPLWSDYFNALDKASTYAEPEVRAEVIKTVAQLLGLLRSSADPDTPRSTPRALGLLVAMAKPPLNEPTARSTHNGRTIKVGAAYEREFERYLIHLFLEQQPESVAVFLDSAVARSFPVENRLVATLALDPKA